MGSVRVQGSGSPTTSSIPRSQPLQGCEERVAEQAGSPAQPGPVSLACWEGRPRVQRDSEHPFWLEPRLEARPPEGPWPSHLDPAFLILK